MSTKISLKHVEIRPGSWRNFRGEKTDFNDKGKRNFCAFLTKEQADYLKSEGLNVKERPPREEGDDWMYYVKVNVNIESNWPPRIYICTSDHEGGMNESMLELPKGEKGSPEWKHDIERYGYEVGEIDNMDIQYANLIVNLNESDSPIYGHTVTAYLNSAALVISDSEGADLFDWR